jgi:hypothetical protein
MVTVLQRVLQRRQLPDYWVIPSLFCSNAGQTPVKVLYGQAGRGPLAPCAST